MNDITALGEGINPVGVVDENGDVCLSTDFLYFGSFRVGARDSAGFVGEIQGVEFLLDPGAEWTAGEGIQDAISHIKKNGV